MPASRAASVPDRRHPRRRGLLRSDDAVSEVVGQILMFGILSMVLILSLLGFSAAKEGAEGRVAALEAESMAQRVAGVYVGASLFAEKHAEENVQYERRVELPDGIQQRPFTVRVESETLILEIASIGVEASASLLSAGAPPKLVVCEQTAGLPGGPLLVKARPFDSSSAVDLALCPNADPATDHGHIILFLESA